MKNLKRKVILSAIVLVFAFIATIGSTFAWFTVAQSVEVQSMELSVQASDSLMMRVYDPSSNIGEGGNADLSVASTYSTTITNDDITAFYPFISEGWTLQPVTAITSDYVSVDVVTLNTMDINDYTRPLVAATSSNAAGGEYIQFKFWVLSQSDVEQEVVLQDLSIVTTAENTLEQDDVVNAIRVGVYPDYQYPHQETDTAIVSSLNVFGLDTDYGFAFTDPNSPGYWDGSDQGTASIDTWKFNDLSSLSTDVSGTMDYTTDQNANWYDSSGTITTGPATDVKADATSVFTVPAATAPLDPILVTVKIFLEGWDAETTNDVISAQFQISFKFAFKNQGV